MADDPQTMTQAQATAAMSMRARAMTPALQTAGSEGDFSSLHRQADGSYTGPESLTEAGIRPMLTDSETNQGRALAVQPFNSGDEAVAGVAGAQATATGQPFSEAYDSALEHARDIQHRYEAEHPYESLALSLPGNIAGTLAIPGGKLVEGTVGGLLQGFGSGEGLGDRMMKGLINSALGGATALVTGGASRYAMRKSIPEASRGADFVQNIADTSGIDVNAIPATTKPFTAAEALGPRGETHLMAVVRREGETGDKLIPEMRIRAVERPLRIKDDMALTAGIHPDAANGDIEAFVQSGQAKANPLFKKALGGSGPVWNADLARLADRPAIAKAISLAEDELRNRDIDPEVLGLGGKLVRDANGRIQRAPAPTALAWDTIRKSLNRSVERNAFGKVIPDSESAGNTAINQASRDLTEALKNSIPGYGDALAVSSDYLSAKSAFTRGQDMILNGKVTEDQFVKMVAKLDPGDLEALKGGIANKLFELAQNGKLRPAQFINARVQAKLSAALGPNQAAYFIKNLDDEARMAAFESRSVSAAGSQTAPLSKAMEEQDNFGRSKGAQIVEDTLMGKPSLTGMINRAAGSVVKHGYNKVSDALKTSGLSVGARDEAGRLLMLPQNDLAAALRAANTGPQGVIGKAAGLINRGSPLVSTIPPLLLTHRAATVQ